ncbi:MAG: tRNA lysidine(34) synthetase TilS [bacterium]|nr:tRNA lysidine(34) synthetase TilS [bacterium]
MRGAKPHADIEGAIARDGIVRAGDRVAIACSGGADSIALAGLLAAVRATLDLQLTLAYVHHGTRDSAWQDECVVLRAGATFGIPVRVVQLEPDACDESTLRTARYEALARVAREVGANAVATAHHREDQCETVLLALFRGAGPDGIAGMPPRRELVPGIDLVRPLLQRGVEELRAYCHAQALPYAVDPTNADLGLRRNAVRAALEALRPLFPGLDAAVARSAEIVGSELVRSDRATLRRQVREALDAQEGLRDVDFVHVEAVVRALERGASGRFHVRTGVEIVVERGEIARIDRE